LQYSFEPSKEIGKFKIGLKVNGLYIDNKFKWNAGPNLIINI